MSEVPEDKSDVIQKRAKQRRRVLSESEVEKSSKDLSRHKAEVAREKQRFLDALSDKSGIVSFACKQTHVNRNTYHYWKNNDPDFAEAVQNIEQEQKEVVEARLLRKIHEGDTRAITFYLERKGKDLGYANSVEMSGANGQPIKIDGTSHKDFEEEVPALALEKILARIKS